MKLDEIADKIRQHLKRFEADPTINIRNDKYKTTRFYFANSWAGGSRVFVKYINYQGQSSLKKQEALDYLAWLDAGNIGRHYEQQHEAKVNDRQTENKDA